MLPLLLLRSGYFYTFLKSSNQNFVKKMTTAILYADITLYKLNSQHMTNLFQEISRSLPSKNTCRKTVLESQKREILRVETALDNRRNILIVDESTLSATPYSNIPVQKCTIKYCKDDSQILTSVPTSESISQATDDAFRSLDTL